MAAITLAQKITTYTAARLSLVSTLLDAANDIAELLIELSEREIYNDIRTSCDITEILTIRPDATPEFFDEYEAYTGSQQLNAGESAQMMAYIEEGLSEVAWLDIVDVICGHVGYRGLTEAECHAIDAGAQWWIPATAYPSDSICKLPSSLILPDLQYEITSRAADSVTIYVKNNSSYNARIGFRVGYMALASEQRFIKYRVTDETSISKYGRRVMNLTWTLGMHPNTMQQMINEYISRYAEPVALLYARIQGKDDRLASFILNAKVDDKVRIQHAGLGIDNDFWINQIAPTHRTEGMLEGDFILEQVRTIETAVLFRWDSSIWDGGDVWAP